MPRKFNPPPGWPPPPPGWQPGPNWRPDPSWPMPPAGWSFWVDEPATPRQDWSGREVQVRVAAPAPSPSPTLLVQPPFTPDQPSSGRHGALASERVVAAAPMSFAGSVQRLARLPESVGSPYLRAIAWALTIVL